MKTFQLLVVATTLLACAAYGQKPAAPHVRAATPAAGPATTAVAPNGSAAPHIRAGSTAGAAAPARVSDAQIDATIRMKLAKSKIAVEKFRFHTQGGVVTIEGKTDVIQRKGAATRIAHTSGAIGVVNQIEISDAAKERATTNLESGRRRAQVTRGDTKSGPRSDVKSPGGTK